MFALEGAMGTETVALLRETHWPQAVAAIWSSGLFVHAGVFFSASCSGARGALQGGVAILCPSPWTVASQRVFVPGCVVT
eukprot:11195996-Lingulodinium_polyedra.AAC.1